MMNMNEAVQIGTEILQLPKKVIAKAHAVAKEMAVDPRHLGPMTLALAIMGVAKATDPKELSGELTDALALVSKAEREWRMKRKMN